MPSFSSTIEEEGILFRAFRVRRDGIFDEAELMARLTKAPIRRAIQPRTAPYFGPACGVRNRRAKHSHHVCRIWRRHGERLCRICAGQCGRNVRQVIDRLHDASFGVDMDCGAIIRVALTVDRAARCLNVDFTGTSAQMDNNFNAPARFARGCSLCFQMYGRCGYSDE